LEKTLTTEDAKKASVEELFTTLSTDSRGLTSSVAKERFSEFGANEIAEKKLIHF
jgi:magnesium-transporting ATPase (P-type)